MSATDTLQDSEVLDPTPSAFIHMSRDRKVKNALATVWAVGAFVVALVPLAWLLWTVISRGWAAVTGPTWWTNSLKGVLPEQYTGGVYHALMGSFIQVGIASLIAMPLGLVVAIYLVEYGTGQLARATTFMVDILSGVPSIVAALFVFAFWITMLGFQQSAFAVSLALALLMLPIVVRNTEEMLKLVPDELREASYALGVPKWRTIVKVVLPTALSGIISGLILSVARVMGETAPVLVLVGYSRSINTNPFDGNMASLPLLIYTELTNPLPAGQFRIWGAALTLITVIAILYVVALLAARYAAPKKS